MARTGRLLLGAVIAAALPGFAYWVWPTPWAYYELHDPGQVRGERWPLAWRRHRFTGELGFLTRSGWTEPTPEPRGTTIGAALSAPRELHTWGPRIRRDIDGNVLDVSPSLGTGGIDLGSADRVFPGLRFEVSHVDRNGIARAKGFVVVTRAVDSHYSQVRIESQERDAVPIGRGDSIASPFFDAERPIHVHVSRLVTSRRLAEERLTAMGGVIDSDPGAGTDCLVVPTRPTPPVPGEGAAGSEEREYEALPSVAKTFDSTLISEDAMRASLGD